MLLTPEQEQQLIEENMPKIYRAVDNFTARCSADESSRVPYEDFVQEVMLSFLKYIRKCKSEKELQKFPWNTATGAMRDLVLVYQPVACPSSPHRFSEIIHSMPRTISIDAIQATNGVDVDGMSKHWVDDKDTQIDFDVFMDGQTENLRRVASMRVYGMNVKQIAEQCGVSRVVIHRRLNKLSDEYRKFVEEDENAK